MVETEDGMKEGRKDFDAGVSEGLRRETPEVRLVVDVKTARETLGPTARAMLAALPAFTPLVPQEGMFQ
jgi:hypothetical protein